MKADDVLVAQAKELEARADLWRALVEAVKVLVTLARNAAAGQ